MGASGDMLMGALFELLPEKDDKDAFLNKINNLGLKGVRVNAGPSVKCGIMGSHISVTVDGIEEINLDVDIKNHSQIHGNSHHHKHEHSNKNNNCHKALKDIQTILSCLSVSENIKKQSLDIFTLIAEAESFIHGKPIYDIHFHEVGNSDAITDIIGVCLLMEALAPEKVIVSPIHLGSGLIHCSHGILPVPAPATAHILKGIPSYSGKINGELCTPTGAALLRHFADDFDSMPIMKVQQIGYGMGKKDFEVANCVRIFLGESIKERGVEGITNNRVAELCCNLDDMTSEAIGFACQTLLDAGALDVFTGAIGMKKNRTGFLLTCICDENKADMFASLMLKHTTTFGIRTAILDRYILERKTEILETPFGKVRIKTGKGFGITKSKLEYDDVAALSKEHKISFAEMEHQIWLYLNHQENK